MSRIQGSGFGGVGHSKKSRGLVDRLRGWKKLKMPYLSIAADLALSASKAFIN